MKMLSVILKLLYGAVTYDVSGNVTSKAENISLQHGTPEWVNFLKHLRANGVTKAEVQNVYDLREINKDEPVESLKRYKVVSDVSDVSKIQDEVNEFIKIPTAEMTPEQKQIKELQDKLASILDGNTSFKPLSKVLSDGSGNELKLAREEYEKVVGKKGGPSWTVEQINQKIEDFMALETARASYLEVVGEKADDALTLEELLIKIREKQS